jgi:hypothetical protein
VVGLAENHNSDEKEPSHYKAKSSIAFNPSLLYSNKFIPRVSSNTYFSKRHSIPTSYNTLYSRKCLLPAFHAPTAHLRTSAPLILVPFLLASVTSYLARPEMTCLLQKPTQLSNGPHTHEILRRTIPATYLETASTPRLPPPQANVFLLQTACLLPITKVMSIRTTTH